MTMSTSTRTTRWRGLSSQGLIWAFTTTHTKMWQPLTWLSLMLDCQLYGLNAGGHHVTNVLLHAATAVLLFLVFRRMTGQLWPSALVAGLFAIHPLRAESVAWVTERKDVLSGLFFMLTCGICPLRAAAFFAGPLPTGGFLLCPGADGQTVAGDRAVCVAVVGLLAVTAVLL